MGVFDLLQGSFGEGTEEVTFTIELSERTVAEEFAEARQIHRARREAAEQEKRRDKHGRLCVYCYGIRQRVEGAVCKDCGLERAE